MTPGFGRHFGNPPLETRMLYFLSQDIPNSLHVTESCYAIKLERFHPVNWHNVVLTAQHGEVGWVSQEEERRVEKGSYAHLRAGLGRKGRCFSLPLTLAVRRPQGAGHEMETSFPFQSGLQRSGGFPKLVPFCGSFHISRSSKRGRT